MTGSLVPTPVITRADRDPAAPGVWEKAWRHRPSAEKDDALLARERAGPRFAAILARLQATFGRVQGLRTIELGCGRGDLSALLARQGAEVTLFDRSDAALREARWRFDRLGLDAHYSTGDMLEPAGPRAGAFDVALSSGVIEHFTGDDRTLALRAHLDVLAPGGLAVVSVPNAWCPPYRLWKFYLELRGWWPYGRELPYTRREILRRAGQAGFARVSACCAGLWQSVGDHLLRDMRGRRVDWAGLRSPFDRWFGFVLLLFAWRDEADGQR